MTIEQLTQEDIAKISSEARINIGSMIGTDTVLAVNNIIAETKPSAGEISATVRAKLQELYPVFNFSLTKQ